MSNVELAKKICACGREFHTNVLMDWQDCEKCWVTRVMENIGKVYEELETGSKRGRKIPSTEVF